MTNEKTELEPIDFELKDGSVYTLRGEPRLRAFDQKYGDDDLDAVKETFRESVAQHWENRTKPWRGITVDWGGDPYSAEYGEETFENHADLAEPVMYSSLRAALMAIAMAEDADEDDSKPRVIGLRDDGAVTYTGDEVLEHDSIEDALDEGED